MRAALLLVCAVGAASPSSSAPVAQARPDERILKVERWLKAVLHHEPGAADEAVAEIGGWSGAELQALWVDVNVLTQLMRNPRLNAFVARTTGQRGQRKPPLVAYSSQQSRRLRILAVAAAGSVNEPAGVQLGAPGGLDDDLRRLAARASASKFAGDANYVLRRGTLLHTDLAMRSSDVIEPLTAGAAGPERFVLSTSDGREVALGQGAVHWDIARLLLDRVSPDRDSMVRSWYHATSAWMQHSDYYDPGHLERARAMFPDDATIQFLSGCEREAYARPDLQAAVRTASLPSGFVLSSGSERAELAAAAGFFRRALTLHPDFTEARLRLGRVLLARGQHKDAAGELRLALARTSDDLLRYYGALFLGAADEASGDEDLARTSYALAAQLYPNAQSPPLALSALARRRGDRAGALAEVRRVFEIAYSAPEHDDPWWSYHRSQARNADALIDDLFRPFREAAP
jgi:tetratricopeptide (TPR) repeat protein